MKTLESIVLGMGCFWGAEKRMGVLPGVLSVESGYANGEVAGDYNTVLGHERLVQMGKTSLRNHAEVVRVTFDPEKISLESVLIHFWENHDPTQGDRQGNDVGTNYRSAIYTVSDTQQAVALRTRDVYQSALQNAGLKAITTEIAPLEKYYPAEEYHQQYLRKNPNGYCGLGGTGVSWPAYRPESAELGRLNPAALHTDRQLIVFEAPDCPHCQQFKTEILDHWQADVPVARSVSTLPPNGWQLEKAVFATPTIVLFENGKEVSRYTGYTNDGDDGHNGKGKTRFWKWLGFHLLTPEQQRIAYAQGTERPGTGSHLDEHRPGTFVDPVTGVPLFRSDTKFNSGTGWPSFFNPLPDALTEHVDESHGMRRVEVRSASSGIHLGHVFDDGPPPTGKRYCINGNVLRFVPDEP